MPALRKPERRRLRIVFEIARCDLYTFREVVKMMREKAFLLAAEGALIRIGLGAEGEEGWRGFIAKDGANGARGSRCVLEVDLDAARVDAEAGEPIGARTVRTFEARRASKKRRAT